MASSTLPAWALAKADPRELVRQASANEVANSYGRRPPIRYELRKTGKKSDTTKQIVETPDGGVARLIAIDDRPLGKEQAQREDTRLRGLLADPSTEKHRLHGEKRDAEKVRKIIRLLPDAFLYRYIGAQDSPEGDLIRLQFSPNPKFTPQDFESRVLSGIRGEIWIDPAQVRVAHVEGKLFKAVGYGWGIIGSIYPGGVVRIDQKKTPECGWQLARLSLHMKGKALLMKNIKIDVEESARNYAFVPNKWTYKDAVEWLLQE